MTSNVEMFVNILSRWWFWLPAGGMFFLCAILLGASPNHSPPRVLFAVAIAAVGLAETQDDALWIRNLLYFIAGAWFMNGLFLVVTA